MLSAMKQRWRPYDTCERHVARDLTLAFCAGAAGLIGAGKTPFNSDRCQQGSKVNCRVEEPQRDTFQRTLISQRYFFRIVGSEKPLLCDGDRGGGGPITWPRAS